MMATPTPGWIPAAAVSLRDYIGGSSGQLPGAPTQGIIARADDLEVAILVECGAVREVRG